MLKSNGSVTNGDCLHTTYHKTTIDGIPKAPNIHTQSFLHSNRL